MTSTHTRTRNQSQATTKALLTKIAELEELVEDLKDIVQAPAIIAARKNEPSYPWDEVKKEILGR